MTEPAASRARRRSVRSTSSASTCGPRRAAQAEKVIRLLRGLVDHFADAPRRLPTVARRRGVGAGRARVSEAAALAVHYVSGMTDRFALGLGVELLGWRPDDLPRGV